MIMNRFRYIILLTAFALGILQSCDKNEENISKNEVNLTLSEQTVIFECGAGQSTTVSVQSDKEWTINGITDGVLRWLEVEYLGEAGESVVHVNCIEANPFEEKRVAMLDFVIDGKVKETLMISQYSDPDRTVSLSVDRLDFSAVSGEEKTFTVVTNKEWAIEDYTDEVAAWVEVTPTSGAGVSEVKVKMLSPGSEFENRSVELGFRIDRVHCAYLHIFQKASSEITLSSDLVSLKSQAEASATLTVLSTSSSLEWQVEGYTEEVQEWLLINPLKGLGSQDVRFTAITENESDMRRTVELRFRLTENLYADVLVAQDAFESEVQLWSDGPKWATRNLGAAKPWIYGDYYSWGAAEPMYKSIDYGDPSDGGYVPSVTWGKILADFGVEEGVKYNSKAIFDGYKIKNAPYSTISSYKKYTGTDGLTMLSDNDDAANVVMGTDWRIPTVQDWQNLYTHCAWTWMEAGNSEYDGVSGYKVEGKGYYSEKSIFIPAAGYFVSNELKSSRTNGYYWTSELHTDILRAWRPTFTDSKVTVTGSTNRCYGLPIRPVRD